MPIDALAAIAAARRFADSKGRAPWRAESVRAERALVAGYDCWRVMADDAPPPGEPDWWFEFDGTSVTLVDAETGACIGTEGINSRTLFVPSREEPPPVATIDRLRRRRSLCFSAALAFACALVSVLALGWSGDRFLLAGSTPATIWAPDLSRSLVVMLVGVPMAIIAAARRRARVYALALWLALLGVTTHRIIDGCRDGLRDVWLGMTVARFPAYAETDVAPHPCNAGLPTTMCFTRGGHPHRLVTIVPFSPM